MSVGLHLEHPERSEVLARYGPLLQRLADAPSVDPSRSALVDEAAAVWSRPGFDTVLSAPRLGFSPFDYQLATMQTVLRRMRGRAILADEVGLGKTIEAGLVLSELRMRGLADRALVITPAGSGRSVARGAGTQVRACPRRSRRAAAGRSARTGRSCWRRSPRPGATRCARRSPASAGTW